MLNDVLCAVSCRVMLCCVVSRYFVLCFVMLCRVVSFSAVLCCVVSCCFSCVVKCSVLFCYCASCCFVYPTGRWGIFARRVCFASLKHHKCWTVLEVCKAVHKYRYYSGREAPSLGFGSGSSCSRRTCQRMRARMRCAS